MYLKRLEIQGFKSFANKTTLEFEKGITAVVGPNGSGKSNVADSIRWVLGEQSLKQLRGKKSEDVIFAGSEKKPRMSFAQVTVTFDNRDRRIPLDYAEVSITRSLDRSGESDYFLNGNKVRLLDVIDLVLKSNIGTSRHTVIGQGTIDQMILAGPAEVKNLLDEASGVKTYYIRRDKSLKRLEQTAQNLMRVKDLLAEIEPRLKSLRRQAKRMEERAVIEQELKGYQLQFYSEKFWNQEEALKKLEEQLGVLTAKRNSLEAEIDDLRKQLDQSEGDNRTEVDSYQQVQNEIKKLGEKKNKLTEDIALIRGKLQAEKTIGSTDPKSLELEKRKLENEKARLNAEIQNTTKSVEELDGQLGQQQAIFADIASKLAEIQVSLENPENINFQNLASDVETLNEKFNQFYENLEQATDASVIVAYAQDFKSELKSFKDRTLELVQNPFANFEKQRRVLSEILSQKDKISEELNSLQLRKSKLNINLDYLQQEFAKTEQSLMHIGLELQKASSGNVDEYLQKMFAQEQELATHVGAVSEEIKTLESRISEYHNKEQQRKRGLLEVERAYRMRQDELSKLRDQEGSLLIEKTRLDTQKEAMLGEIFQALGDDGMNKIKQERAALTVSNLEERINRLKHQIELIGGIDELTLKEYQETEERYTYLHNQVTDLEQGMNDLRSVIDELDQHIKKQFNESFTKINEQFENYFRILFNGGRAYLSLVRSGKGEEVEAEEDTEEPEEQVSESMRPEEKILAKYEHGAYDVTGVDIKATPPGKKLQSISALSGGERSLTSIALLCALLSCFPSPFVMLDEVDAALDEANTIRFAQILGTLAHQTQFVTVTHNRETMRQAHTLYGVTMGDDSISKILSIKIEQAQAYAK
jgi:chromosome segregation protein